MRILYIAYWGLLEPLGQSLIWPSVRGLAERGVGVTLVTFEKRRDWSDQRHREASQVLLDEAGIEWRPRPYHKRPTIPATGVDVVAGVGAGIKGRIRTGRFDLVHGRTPIGALMGMMLGKALGVPFVCHHEGFWADQQVEGGFWKAGGVLYRMMKRLEQLVHEHADGIVVLSRRSIPLVQAFPRVSLRRPPIVMVPSCVSSTLLADTQTTCAQASPAQLAYVGSLGGRYLVEPLGRFLRAYRRHVPDARLMVLSQSDPALASAGLSAVGIERPDYSCDRVAAAEVPRRLADSCAGLFFLQAGRGALTSSATKVGEYWACGLPVVCNPGLGDLDEIIAERRVGVLVSDWSDSSMDAAADALLQLLRDPGLPARCRQAAEDFYGLDPALDRLRALYETLVSS